jgi:hypothetical protein
LSNTFKQFHHDIRHAFAENTRRAAFHTLFTADAIIGISDDNVFVPQETDFANNIARAVVDTFPAGSTRSGVHPYVWSMDTL